MATTKAERFFELMDEFVEAKIEYATAFGADKEYFGVHHAQKLATLEKLIIPAFERAVEEAVQRKNHQEC